MARTGSQQIRVLAEQAGVNPVQGSTPNYLRRREHDRWRPTDWVVLVVALGAIGAGLVLGQALLLAGGLFLAASIKPLRKPNSTTRRGGGTDRCPGRS